MAKPNFQFQKRQKELERKKKNEEKLQRRQAAKAGQADDGQPENSDGEAAPAEEEG